MPSRQSVLERSVGSGGGGVNADANVAATWLDDSAGAVLAKLESLNQLDNTVFLFAMDHGVGNKGSLYEAGSRIAMFARYPNDPLKRFEKGTRRSGVVGNVDIAPTLLELAGMPAQMASANMDGRSLLSNANANRDPFLNAKAEGDTYKFLELNKDRALVSSKWKLILLGPTCSSASAATESAAVKA